MQPAPATTNMFIIGISFILVYCSPTVALGVLAAFWSIVNTSNISNLQQPNQHLVTTASRSEGLQLAPQALSLPNIASIVSSQHLFPSEYIFLHCERGGYITMTRSHEYQHSAPVFNPQHITAWKDFLSKLFGFLSLWFCLVFHGV